MSSEIVFGMGLLIVSSGLLVLFVNKLVSSIK